MDTPLSLVCHSCGKSRPPRSFRHPYIRRKPDGTTRTTHKTTNECAYCFRARLSKAGEHTLSVLAERGKISFVAANERRKRREAKRRQKIRNAVTARWQRIYRAQRNAHPVTKELRRVAALRRNLELQHHARAPLDAFIHQYTAQLHQLHQQLREVPQLTAKPTQVFSRAVLAVQEWAKREWAALTPSDRGNYAPPKKLTACQ